VTGDGRLGGGSVGRVSRPSNQPGSNEAGSRGASRDAPTHSARLRRLAPGGQAACLEQDLNGRLQAVSARVLAAGLPILNRGSVYADAGGELALGQAASAAVAQNQPGKGLRRPASHLPRRRSPSRGRRHAGERLEHRGSLWRARIVSDHAPQQRCLLQLSVYARAWFFQDGSPQPDPVSEAMSSAHRTLLVAVAGLRPAGSRSSTAATVARPGALSALPRLSEACFRRGVRQRDGV
jgi:hypothetical protein